MGREKVAMSMGCSDCCVCGGGEGRELGCEDFGDVGCEFVADAGGAGAACYDADFLGGGGHGRGLEVLCWRIGGKEKRVGSGLGMGKKVTYIEIEQDLPCPAIVHHT
jgi:hypothetical protein